METKQCKDCQQTKPLDRFSLERKDKPTRRNYCKECGQVRYREDRQKNLEKRLAKAREYKKLHPEKAKGKPTTGFCPHCKQKVEKLLTEP